MTTQLSTRDGWWKFRDVIAKGEQFKTHGALRSITTRSTLGRLPREYHTSVSSADYVIYSYATPIAWREEGQWITPDVKYSATTSRHQSKVFTAIAELR